MKNVQNKINQCNFGICTFRRNFDRCFVYNTQKLKKKKDASFESRFNTKCCTVGIKQCLAEFELVFISKIAKLASNELKRSFLRFSSLL